MTDLRRSPTRLVEESAGRAGAGGSTDAVVKSEKAYLSIPSYGTWLQESYGMVLSDSYETRRVLPRLFVSLYVSDLFNVTISTSKALAAGCANRVRRAEDTSP